MGLTKAEKKLYNELVLEARRLEHDELDPAAALAVYKRLFELDSTSHRIQKKIAKLGGIVQTLAGSAGHTGQDMGEGSSDHGNERVLIDNGPWSRTKSNQDVKVFIDGQNVDGKDGFILPWRVYDRLYRHQREGVAWMYDLFHRQQGGCVLGDDMGLGKTSQVCALILGLLNAKRITTALIVAPLSVTEHWKSELDNFAQWVDINSNTHYSPSPDRLNIAVLHGQSSKERRKHDIVTLQSRGGVCITTYGMVSSNVELLKANGIVWDAVILDEGHKIRNPSILAAESLVKVRSVFRVIMTGTPIQNNLLELWALFDFVCAGKLLGSKRAFRVEFETPISMGSAADATETQRVLGNERSAALRQMIKPHFLRREKEKEKERNVVFKSKLATTKHELVVWVKLTATQVEMYKECAPEKDKEKEKENLNTGFPLAILQTLRKICQHPLLHQEKEKEKGMQELLVDSHKLRMVHALVSQFIAHGHRALVFSQSVKMLDIIAIVLGEMGVAWLRLDGVNTKKPADRKKVMDTFNSDISYPVMLLTTQCGGLGVNLTGADRVIVYDPSWNPSADAQAVDRAYRMGQTKDVVVYRLITCGTIEEKIYRKQVFKDALMRTTVQRSNPLRYFTRAEMREILKLGDINRSETCEHLNAVHGDNEGSLPLQEHVDWLINECQAVGVSRHTLLFSKSDHRDVCLTPDQERSAGLASAKRIMNHTLMSVQRGAGEGGGVHVTEGEVEVEVEDAKVVRRIDFSDVGEEEEEQEEEGVEGEVEEVEEAQEEESEDDEEEFFTAEDDSEDEEAVGTMMELEVDAMSDESVSCCENHASIIAHSVGGRCNRCRCFVKDIEDRKRYNFEVAELRHALKQRGYSGALKHCSAALVICNDDPKLVRIALKLYSQMK